MPEQNLNDLKALYDQAFGSQLASLTSSVNNISNILAEIKITLASYNLEELKKEVNSHRETLLTYNLSKMSQKVDRHDVLLTRALAIVVFIQVAIGIVLGILNYIKR